MSAEILLNKVKLIGDKYDLIHQKTGGYFNIFQITNIGTNEVIICRVLHELLSPSGSHYQGSLYLKSFIKEVLKLDVTDDEISTANVYREYVTDNNRRIDLAIETTNKSIANEKRFIPIEVKIYAGEQKNQCHDYYEKAENSNVYYLTRFGDGPSEYSLGGLSENNITLISFERDILDWLDSCLREKETITIAPIREVILQLAAMIRKFTDKMEDEKEMEIKSVLMKSPDNMRNAIEIQKSVDQCKLDLMKKLFESIEKKVQNEKLVNEFDYAYDNYSRLKKFYDKKQSTWPGLSYLYRENIKTNIDLWVRLEIDNRIFIGFCIGTKDGKWAGDALNIEEKKQLFDKVKCSDKNWWVNDEYILESSENDSPNFKDANEAFIQLFDDNKFDRFTDVCVEKIKIFLENNEYRGINSSNNICSR